jgi:hypothetical protein
VDRCECFDLGFLSGVVVREIKRMGFASTIVAWFGGLTPCYPPSVYRLKQFDESTVVSRRGSAAGTPPMSVKGIGNKGAFRLTTDTCYPPNI